MSGLEDVAGLRVGHWTDSEAMTGVTVVRCPAGTVGSVEVRGLAPGTRETELLAPHMTVDRVDAVCLCGGSAFGLGAAQGVVEMLASMGQGYPTAAGPVPIVPAAVVFDLAVGRPAWPTPADAVRALEASNGTEVGRVGAGAGTLVGRRAGPEWASPGGIGQASASVRGAVGMTVAALAVVNTVGDVVDDAGRVLAGCRHPDPAARVKAEFGTSTALLVVATNAKMAKVEAFLMAQRAQDALAVCVRPAHTRYDGDVAFSLATGEVEITRPEALDQIAEAVGDVTVAAIRQAVGG